MSDGNEHAGLPPEALGEAPGRGRLTGRRIAVVGAGQIDSPFAEDASGLHPIGNGRAISLLAAREGATVACVDANEEAAARTASIIESEGGAAEVVVADVSRPDGCSDALAGSVDAVGGLDGLVLNVGIGLGRGLAGTTPEQWDATFAVNLRSHFLISRAALEQEAMRSIVFIGSVAGETPGSGVPAYNVSKAGLVGLCREIAQAGVRRSIRANLVQPGLMDTPLGRMASSMNRDRGAVPIPIGRQGSGWEVAYAVLFLLSEESSYVTGQVLTVDGGLLDLH